MKNNSDEPQNEIPDVSDDALAHYTDAEAHSELFNKKQDVLIPTYQDDNGDSIGNIKTINSESLLGAGNISVAEVNHGHSAADITSGTLAVEKGGTGVSTLTALQALLGSGDVDIVECATDSNWTGDVFCWKANGICTVYLDGVDRDATVAAFTDTIATLPTGYIPENRSYGQCIGYVSDVDVNTIAIRILTSGEVQAYASDNNDIEEGEDLYGSLSFPLNDF